MKKTRMIWIGTLLCLLLTACQPAPGEPANSDTDSTADTSVSQSGNPVEDGTNVGNDIASISDANMELVRSVNGTAIEETITTADGKQILLNAQVNTESVESIQQYQYEVLPVTDELRETLFTTFFGARASEAIYDQRNDVWELHNSEAIGDYYLYEHTIAMAGESVPGEEIFTLGYRDVNLYPFEDNLLSSSAECGVSIPLEDVISLCGTITDAIAPQNSYTADTVLPYGNQGRRPYYTIFFRRTAGGMPIIGYNDLYFLVDSNGIQTISGALYGLTAQPLSSELLSLEDAVASLRENTSLIDFYGEDSAVYYLVLFIAGALFISENAFVANIWSLPLTVLVQNQAPELAWEYQVSFPYGHLLTLTPAIACVLSYLLSVCYVFVMSLIIFWLNLRISKVLSYLAAVLVHVAGYILTIGFLTDSYRKFSLLANSLLMYHNINGSEVETAYLALPQSFLVYAAVAVMLFLLILHAIHSYDFRITVGTKQ